MHVYRATRGSVPVNAAPEYRGFRVTIYLQPGFKVPNMYTTSKNGINLSPRGEISLLRVYSTKAERERKQGERERERKRKRWFILKAGGRKEAKAEDKRGWAGAQFSDNFG